MVEDKLNPLDNGPLEIPERCKHEFVLGTSGEGWGCVVLSRDTVAGLVNEGVKFVKNGKELVLTKDEIINEVKIGLRKGYFTKEDLFD
ncbi:hypothetical protein [Bacillus cereus]|uniref:hypothetical protein n=1 Tax=Bacillus cereus TaxID=1396 RepID=UPI000B4AC731|nr:hypothetical protein [Bacillus cereus]